jgi:S1-C subfamily serine protease
MLTDAARPRVSRETRRLLAAAGLALVALWILARLRFPDRPLANPVSPVLTQISPPATFADLAGEADEVRRRIAPALAEIAAADVDGTTQTFPVWPLRDQMGLALLPHETTDDGHGAIQARDPATGLAVVRIANAPAGRLPIWTPDRLDAARYIFAAAPEVAGTTVRPTYVSVLDPRRSPAWSTDIWRVPRGTDLAAGAFLFTSSGEWIGIATVESGDHVIVPAAALLDRAMRMEDRQGTGAAADPGIEVQALTTPLAAATNATAGVIVAFVDPEGVAAKAVDVGDVIEQVNGTVIGTPLGWDVFWSRLPPGTPVMLRVRHRDVTGDVLLTVPPPAARPDGLGLTLTRQPGRGSRVLRIDTGGAADRAGLEAGDIITLAGEQQAPSPAQVRRIFEATPKGSVVLIGLTRGSTHRLVTLTR